MPVLLLLRGALSPLAAHAQAFWELKRHKEALVAAAAAEEGVGLSGTATRFLHFLNSDFVACSAKPDRSLSGLDASPN
jgi:hypothetical protein